MHDPHDMRRAVRNLRVTGAASAALDFLYQVAQKGTKAEFHSALIYYFDQLAGEYEGQVSSLETVVNIQQEEIKRHRRGDPPPSGLHRVRSRRSTIDGIRIEGEEGSE